MLFIGWVLTKYTTTKVAKSKDIVKFSALSFFGIMIKEKVLKIKNPQNPKNGILWIK